MANNNDIDELLKRAVLVHQLIHASLALEMEQLPDSYVRIVSRIKTRESIEGKIKRKRLDNPAYGLDNLTDIIGFRFVCHFRADIERTVRMLIARIKQKNILKDLYEPARLYTTATPHMETLRTSIGALFQKEKLDYQEHVKDSRYTSLHLTCKVDGFQPIEIQIRNVFEEAWSSIEHATQYKGRTVSNSVARHLGVLNSMVQTCVEYAEVIRADIDDRGIDQSGTIEPLIHEDLARFPREAREELEWIMRRREANEHREILEHIQELKTGVATVFASPDAAYLLDMEEALSHLKLNNLPAAQSLYENLATRFPLKIMVPFRLSDVHKLKNDYPAALEFVRRTEELLQTGQASKAEEAWINSQLPLKKAYFLWRTEDVAGAYDELSRAYEQLPRNAEEQLKRKYFSSVVYYALEVAAAGGSIDKPRFEDYIKQMRDFGMDSTDTAMPEEVDTYAWVCHHLGLHDEAQRSMRQVLACVDRTGPSPMFSHKGEKWGILQQDLFSIVDHVAAIFAELPKVGSAPAPAPRTS